MNADTAPPTRAQMVDGLKHLADSMAVLSTTWFIGDHWHGNAADLLWYAAEHLVGLERQPLTGPHGFVKAQTSPTNCLLVVTRAHQGPVLCNLPPEHPIHHGGDI